MAEVVDHPSRRARRKRVDIWHPDIPEPPDEMVHEVCAYLRGVLGEFKCKGCPRWEDDPDHGKTMRMCYALASEACKHALAFAENPALRRAGPRLCKDRK